MDRLGGENQTAGFAAIGALLAAFSVLGFAAVNRIDAPQTQPIGVGKVGATRLLARMAREKSFRPALLMTLLRHLSFGVGVTYFNIYLLSVLDAGYMFISAMLILIAAVKILTLRFWGRFAARSSWRGAARASLAVIAVSMLGAAFLDKGNVNFLYPAYIMVNGAGMAVLEPALMNFIFESAPSEERPAYYGFAQAAGGGVQFLGALAATQALPLAERFFGGALHGQQILTVLGAVLAILAASGAKRRA
jgi:Na+/melibiose symporter-like transporter